MIHITNVFDKLNLALKVVEEISATKGETSNYQPPDKRRKAAEIAQRISKDLTELLRIL